MPQNGTNLRACGLSDRKTEYIADLAQHFVDGKIHARNWPQMSDEEIIAELTDVRGIGRWTAEMFLMFNLLRPDVFPLDDLGLQKGIRVSYFKGRKVSLARMRKLGETLAPLALGGHLVSLARARPGAGRVLGPALG